MTFIDWEFGVLLLVLVAIHHLAPWRVSKVALLVGSYLFYSYAEPWQVGLLGFATLAAFGGGEMIGRAERPAGRKAALVVSVLLLLLPLVWFKYSNFLADQVNALSGMVVGEALLFHPTVTLPSGISFFTFQGLSYVIDIYRRNLPGRPSLIDFALFKAFFPQMVAGPIERAGSILPQLVNRPHASLNDLLAGVERIIWGLGKKLVFADRLGGYTDDVFGRWQTASGAELWLATIAFGFQIYLDFSAYSDIAIGSARLFGIRLMENFRWPYLATDIREFWRRWHISLSIWFRDYVYISLGGNRKSTALVACNLVFVMLIAGFWHGASWNFAFWGLWHGLLIAGMFIKDRVFGQSAWFPRPLGWLMTITVVMLGWVPFRATSMEQAGTILGRMLMLNPIADWMPSAYPFIMVTMLIGVVFLVHSRHGFSSEPKSDKATWLMAARITALSLATYLGANDTTQTFIYSVF